MSRYSYLIEQLKLCKRHCLEASKIAAIAVEKMNANEAYFFEEAFRTISDFALEAYYTASDAKFRAEQLGEDDI